MGVYGPHTQVKRLFKALIFLTCKQNIIVYSQMRFQLYQSHRLTAIGTQSGKKSINWVSVGNLETSSDLKIKVADLKCFTDLEYM